jgi:hypothetical protein
MRILTILFSLAFAACSTVAKDNQVKTESGTETYTFGRFNQNDVTPRGGTTKGGKITFDTSRTKMFDSIKGAKTKKEKDRRAILSQVGEFKVSFEFIETIGFKKDYKLDKPYRSWATEYVFPIKADEDFISLQHILVMQYKDDKGVLSDPVVVKHWRQDWTYQKNEYPIYVGHLTWKKRKLNPIAVKGAWTQEVYQVDDSPRYFSHGRWNHTDQMSIWRSEPTTRPLPRREFSVRSDYDLMQGVNTVTVTPKGWYHEQENYKVVVDKKTLRPIETISKEVGLNTYAKIKNYNFKPGKEYWEKTAPYWATVRGYWKNVFDKEKVVRLKKENEGEKLYKRHFEFASMIKEDKPLPVKVEEHAKKTIDSYLY